MEQPDERSLRSGLGRRQPLRTFALGWEAGEGGGDVFRVDAAPPQVGGDGRVAEVSAAQDLRTLGRSAGVAQVAHVLKVGDRASGVLRGYPSFA